MDDSIRPDPPRPDLGGIRWLPTDVLDLQARTLHNLNKTGIRTLGELLASSAPLLLSVRGFGPEGLVEVCERLRDIGQRLPGGHASRQARTRLCRIPLTNGGGCRYPVEEGKAVCRLHGAMARRDARNGGLRCTPDRICADLGLPFGECGWVYFIQCGDGGPIKIGLSDVKVYARLQTLQNACPYELRLIGVFTGGSRAEAALHERFARLRIRGEWFRPEPELLVWIEQFAERAPDDAQDPREL